MDKRKIKTDVNLNSKTIRELRGKTDMSIADLKKMIRCGVKKIK